MDTRAGATRWWLKQTTAFARGFARSSFRPALARAMPIYALAGLLAGTWIEALAPERALAGQHAWLPALAAGWVVALAYVRRPLFGAVDSEYLRSLPVPRTTVAAFVIATLLCIDLPWIVLCVASRDPAVITAGPALALAGHTALASRRRGFALAFAGILVLACLVSPWWVVAPALVLAVRALPWAWAATLPARFASRPRLHLPVPWIGVARALLSAVVGADAALLRRTSVLLVVMTGAGALAVRNNRLVELVPVLQATLVVLALGLPVAATRVTMGVIEAGWTLSWLYDSNGVRRRDRTLGGLAAVATSGGGLGLVHGVAVALWTRPALTWQLGLIGAAAGAALAVVLLGIAAAAVTSGGIEPIRLLAGTIAVTVLLAFTTGSDLHLGPLIAMPAAIVAAIAYHARVTRSPQEGRAATVVQRC